MSFGDLFLYIYAIMSNKNTRLSKYLSYMLRHNPQSIGIELDNAGWVSVESLIAASRKHGKDIRAKDIYEIIRHSDKQRFTLSRDGKYIRANYGHSINVELGYEPEQPPATLYHGTARRFVPTIRKQGLLPQNRQFVHLAVDRDSATTVGQRHGRPVILDIDSRGMYQDGYTCYQSDAGIWLTKRVPPSYISFPEENQ